VAWAQCAEHWRLPLPELAGARGGQALLAIVVATRIDAGGRQRKVAGGGGHRDQQGGDKQPCLSHDSILGRGAGGEVAAR